MKKYTVLPSTSDVFAVSLVEDPAVESNFVALSKQQPMDFKIQNEERRMIYGVALRADFPIYRRYGDEEFYLVFEKDAVRRLMTKFMKNFGQKSWTKDHMDFAEGITVVESWIVEDVENDKAKALGLSNYSEGSWMIGAKVDDDEMWQSIKDGRWKGFSIEAWVDMEEMDFKKINKAKDKKMNKFEEMVDKIKNIILEAVEEPETKVEETVEEEEKFEEETKTEEVTVEEEVKEENFEEETKPEEEETKPEEEEQTVQEEEKPNEEVVELQKQIEELKKENEDLKKQNEKMSKQPSTKVVTNGNETKRTGLDAVFASLREQGFID